MNSGKTLLITGAALDVFEFEPLPLDSPHSNSSPTAWERIHWKTIRNFLGELGIDSKGLMGDV